MNKIQKMIIAILSGVLVVMIGVLLFRGTGNSEPVVIIGDFEEPSLDLAAVEGKPEKIDEKLNYQDIVIEDRVKVGMCGNLYLDENKVNIYLTSYETNEFYCKVKLYNEDELLGETGLIKPGEYVTSLVLDVVPSETTPLTAKILTYEPDTYYSKGSISANIGIIVE